MVCTSSFDGHVSVFSLMGGSDSGPDLHHQKVQLQLRVCQAVYFLPFLCSLKLTTVSSSVLLHI